MVKLLAADIGGTNSRFGHFEGNSIHSGLTSGPFSFSTQSVSSFEQLLLQYEQQRQSPFLELSKYDALIFSVPGPVTGTRCTPPNIDWDIDVGPLNYRCFHLINDFVAQSYACLISEIAEQFIAVKQGTVDDSGNIAIVGAGTGLGHCCLSPAPGQDNTRYIPVASEGGHAQFSFCSQEERDFEDFLLGKLGVNYIETDDVVSGRGLVALHEYLSGEILSAQEIASRFNADTVVQQWFSRFYARACRNYSLSVFASGGLIISGGIAAKNPQLVCSNEFKTEFLNSKSLSKTLDKIPIYLNRNEDVGLIGCIYYGMNLLG